MSNTSKCILVTGGAGYIGSHTIVELLSEKEVEIISVDNYSNSSADTYSRIEKITGKKVKHYEIDLCNLTDAEKVFSENKISGVIHFAALKSVPESVSNPIRYYSNNLSSLTNVLYCIKKYKVQNFIFSSSCSVFGNVSVLPVKEETPIDDPQSPYAYTKLVGERIIRDFCFVNKEINAIALRYFNPVGAHLSGTMGELPVNAPNNLVPVITKVAIGELKELHVFGNDYTTRDGTCVRDYIHVSDIAQAHCLALNYLESGRNKANYDIINLGSGEGVTVLEAIKAFEEISGVKLNYKIDLRRPGDVEAIYSDSSKANSLLSWKPKYGLKDMMASAWKWQQYLSSK